MDTAPGGNWIIDDRSGRRIRARDARKEWDGTVVHKDDYEPRHPQDFVRAKVDDQSVALSRPEPIDTFGGNLMTETTADAAAGATTLSVLSSTRMEAGDVVQVMLDNREMFRSLLQAVTDAETIVLHTPLPFAASSGARVIDETAMASVDIG